MAVYNEIGIGRWNRFIQKLTDIKGSPPARQLASEIVFQHPIFHGAENRYLESWDLFGFSASSFAVVGQNSGFQLRNPVGSNVIAVFQKITMAAGATATGFAVEYQLGLNVDLNVLNISIPMENRSRSASTVIVSSNSAGAIASANNIFTSPTNPSSVLVEVIQDTLHEIVLPPGATLILSGQIANTLNFFSVWWRERFLEPAERK